MKKLLIVLLFFFMPNISNAQSSILDHKNISLVFVGVLDYSNCSDDGWPKDLRKDQELFELINSKSKNIKYKEFLYDELATIKNVKQKISEALMGQKKDDLFIFYFAGHGDISGMQMSDCEIFTNQELKEILKNETNGQNIILFGDFCFSGFLVDIAKELSSEGLQISAVSSSTYNSPGTWSYTQTLIDSFSGQSKINISDNEMITFSEMALEVRNVMSNRENEVSDYFISSNLKGKIISQTTKSSPFSHNKIKYGSWYCLDERVVRATNIINSFVEVEYYDFNKYQYEKVSEGKLLQIPLPELEIGDAISVLWDTDIYPATVKQIDGLFYKISYTNYGSEWDEWITKSRIKQDTQIEVELEGNWYPAEIIQQKNNKYFIRYTGYGSCSDEWIDTSRIKKIN